MMKEQPTTEAELIDFVTSIDVRAPAALHERVGALVSEHAQSPRHSGARRLRGGRLVAGLGALAAATAVILVLLLGSGSTGEPKLSLEQASALTLGRATLAGPAEDPRADGRLAAHVDGVAFPYWEGRFGWRSSGARTDHVAGRPAMTVFYTNAAAKRIGYAIVAGTPAPRLAGGTVAWRGGAPYRVLSDGDSRMVVWLRNGRMCVVAGRGVSSATLLRLASWHDNDDTA